jgi:hypothetical protein
LFVEVKKLNQFQAPFLFSSTERPLNIVPATANTLKMPVFTGLQVNMYIEILKYRSISFGIYARSDFAASLRRGGISGKLSKNNKGKK